jgi:uncharacterized repeat protein (TIGR03803 family)
MNPRRSSLASSIPLAIVFTLAVFVTRTMQAQTFHVIYSFDGGLNGVGPIASLTMDATGNLYGTTSQGGNLNCNPPYGCGTAFRLAHSGSGWILTSLYSFAGHDDGASPNAVTIGPDGGLYGSTATGGGSGCGGGGCGTVFKLTPAPTACRTAPCGWTETVLYRFSTPADGYDPLSDVIFDQAGNIYGTTFYGGGGAGIVYELTHSSRGWTKSTLYSFTGGGDGRNLTSGVIFDNTGNLYGTTLYGAGSGCYGEGCGTVFQLTHSGSGWAETTLYAFQDGSDGGVPYGGLVFDRSGNLYGSTFIGGTGNGGTVFELAPSGSNWTYTLLSALPGVYNPGSWGPGSSLTMDVTGNLYGTTVEGGEADDGTVFKLTPSNGSWTYTSLHDFTNGSDGGAPWGSVIFDAAGDLYGTALGGSLGGGVIWEITP